MSLRDGTKKMSKSDESDYSRINLTDDADAIAQKIRKARTDPNPLPDSEKGFEGRPEAENLINIYAALADETRERTIARFAGQQFSAFKNELADWRCRSSRRYVRDAPAAGRPGRDRPHPPRRRP
jgi:tryptophanyl-tRNA synthetase